MMSKGEHCTASEAAMEMMQPPEALRLATTTPGRLCVHGEPPGGGRGATRPPSSRGQAERGGQHEVEFPGLERLLGGEHARRSRARVRDMRQPEVHGALVSYYRTRGSTK